MNLKKLFVLMVAISIMAFGGITFAQGPPGHIDDGPPGLSNGGPPGLSDEGPPGLRDEDKRTGPPEHAKEDRDGPPEHAKDKDRVGPPAHANVPERVREMIEAKKGIERDEEESSVTFIEGKGRENIEIVVHEIVEDEDEKEVGTLTTDSDGKASMDLEEGEYEFTASGELYEEYEGSFDLGEDEIKEVEFELVKLDDVYTVTFAEENELEGVEIEVKKEVEDENNGKEMEKVATLTTDSSGEAVIDLKKGEYDYTATSYLYEEKTGDFILEDESKKIEFELEKLENLSAVTFEEKNKLEDIEIVIYKEIDDEEKFVARDTTDSEGQVEIELREGEYEFLAVGYKYEELRESFEVEDEEKTVEFEMEEVDEELVSTYKFDYDIPENIKERKYVEIDVTFETDFEGHYGYKDVRFKIDTETGEKEGEVDFYAIDEEGKVIEDFTDEGYWGPEEGFQIDADYEETTTWELYFTERGEYEITFSLIDAEDEEVIDDIEDSVEINVKPQVNE